MVDADIAMNSPIHVCILTSAHPIGDVRVYHKFALAFLREGFRVTWVGPDYRFSGSGTCEENGIEYHLFSHAGGMFGRLSAAGKLYRRVRPLSGVDVFYAPDPDSAMVAVRVAGKKGSRVIFDIHEVYHGALLRRWVKGPMAGVAGNILQRRISRLCSRCDLVIGVNRAVLEPFKGATTEQLVLRSCAPAYFAHGPSADVCHPGRDTFTVMHGKADLNRGTGTVLEALCMARKELAGLRSIMFDMFSGRTGSQGREAFLERASDLQVEDVIELHPPVPLQEMPDILRRCDAGLIAYGRDLGADSLPNRLFEYMAAGLPVIAPQYSTEICRILIEEGCGVTADFENPSSIAAAIVELARDPDRCRRMGKRAREAFESRHNWEVEVGPLLNRIRTWVSQ